VIIAKHHHGVTNIISISSILGTQLLFNAEILDKLVDDENSKTIVWYKGITDLKPLVNSHSLSVNFTISIQSRYYIVNRTKLVIKQTSIGDQGFYTLKVQTEPNISKRYLFHVSFIFNQIHAYFPAKSLFQVILFSPNLSLFLSPPSHQQIPYHAEQQINCTCSISLFADRTYIEQSRSIFFSSWYMIIYNTDPDHYQLLPSSSSSSPISYTYISYLVNYELNRNDHNQTISCAFIQEKSQQIILHNISLINKLNIEYKAYLRGNYYFTRSFNAYSLIEINCEEFDGNPKPIYTLIWILNGEYHILLNKTKYGRYFIHNATWKHRGKDFYYVRLFIVMVFLGNYTCFAENYLNNHQPAHQSFRLNIWFNEHQLKSQKIFSFQEISQSNKNKSIILIIIILIFLFSCLFFILSIYCFCLQN
jgi:hypothetical protein